MLLVLVLLADPWTSFRGGDGIAATTLPKSLAGGQSVWRTKLSGRGWSSPVVAGDLLWMTTALDDGRDLRLLAVDRRDGRLVHDIGLLTPSDIKPIHDQNSHASPTPCVAGGLVVAHFGRYGTAAVDAASGQLAWTNTEHVIQHGGGPGSSPVAAAGHVILTMDGADASYVVALDTGSGREVWRRDRSAPKRENPITHRAFATPLVTEHDGRTLVIAPGADQLQAYDAATGQERWHVRYVGFSTVPQPARWDDRVIHTTGFFRPSLRAVTLGGQGDVTRTHLAWEYEGAVPDIPSPLVALDHVWLVTDKGVLTVIDAAVGSRRKVGRLGGNFTASPVFVPTAADAGTIVLGNREGELVTVDVTRQGRTITTAISRVDLGEAMFATCVPLDGALYVRTESALHKFADQ